jgi:hypothetical protein
MNNTKLFEDKKVRTVWDTEQEKWYISVIDVIAVLTESDRPRKYWSDLKKKLEKEGSELSEKIGQLKMLAEFSKMVEIGSVVSTTSRKLESTNKQPTTNNIFIHL